MRGLFSLARKVTLGLPAWKTTFLFYFLDDIFLAACFTSRIPILSLLLFFCISNLVKILI